ncbi:MAG: diheme cytochrome c [Deltaproteobacteria bacterium]
MRVKNIIILVAATAGFLVITKALIGAPAFADGNEREESGGHGKEAGERLMAPDNKLYKDECSSCHLAYPAGLLPGRSWEGIINESKRHFGEDLGLDDGTRKDLSVYLKANSSENAGGELAGKITRSIGSVYPERITEVPYIKKEHRKIREDVFKRQSIKSFSNCSACHRNAENGDFDEDAVSIPK